MRLFPLFPLLALAGCAGHLADYVGSRSSIVSPQLLRYGLDLAQARCVGERLGGTLNPRQLRLLARAAGSLSRGHHDPERLTPPDFAWIATSLRDPEVPHAIDRATGACGVAVTIAAAPSAGDTGPVPGVTILGPGQLPPPTGGPAPALRAGARSSTWLNLGAAGSGQSIAIDASTIEEQGAERTAWFRMTDPGAAGPGDNAYLLRIDCARRTINPRARRRRDAAGAVAEQVDYPDNPLPVEGGTVMEIAFLSLCT